jgi:hypothetical protein
MCVTLTTGAPQLKQRFVVFRSKRSLGWRTCLVVPELEHELEAASR